jgi:hypothetical protein
MSQVWDSGSLAPLSDKERLMANGKTLSERVSRLEVLQDETSKKLDGIAVTLDKIQAGISTAIADANASPAGRSLIEAIQDSKDDRQAIHLELKEIQHKLWMFTGGLTVIIFIFNIIGPTVARWFGLPT